MFINNRKQPHYEKSKDEVVVDLMHKVVADLPASGGIIVGWEAVPDFTENEVLQMQELNYDVQDLMRSYGYIGTSTAYAQPITPIGHAARKAGGHYSYQRSLEDRSKPQPINTNIYNLSGNNSRVYHNSQDYSTNNVSSENKELFRQLREEISNRIEENGQLLLLLSEMEQAVDKPSYVEKYKSFIANAANHMTVITPFIPALTSLLSGS